MTVHKTKLTNRNPNTIATQKLASHWIVHHPHLQWMTTYANLPIQLGICIGDYVICDGIADMFNFWIFDISNFTQSSKLIFKCHLHCILLDKIEMEHTANHDFMDCLSAVIGFDIVSIDVYIIISWKSMIKTYIISFTKIVNWTRTRLLRYGCTFSSLSMTWIISDTSNCEIKPENILMFSDNQFSNTFIADLGFTYQRGDDLLT
jgi:hypothetical protein